MKIPRFHGHGRAVEEPPPVPDSFFTSFYKKATEASKRQIQRLRPYQQQIVVGAAAVVGLAVAFQTVAIVHTAVLRRRRAQLIERCGEGDELFVFILPRSPWAPSLSPACTRVEAYLRANSIPYRAIETIDPFGSPSGELPFIVYKGTRVDQLPRIFEFLSLHFNVTMDDDLTREERAVGAALRRTLEYSMERFLYRTVFIDHPALAITQIARALHITQLRARVAVNRYARQLKQQLAMTSYGALVSEQYENEFLLDCEALEAQIGNKRFLFSNAEPTSYDCAVYALLVPFAYMGKFTSLSTAYTAVSESTVLMGYVARISKHLFSDVASRFDAAQFSFETSPTSSPPRSISAADNAHVEDEYDVKADVEVFDDDVRRSAQSRTHGDSTGALERRADYGASALAQNVAESAKRASPAPPSPSKEARV